jgi:hypothetical protein
MNTYVRFVCKRRRMNTCNFVELKTRRINTYRKTGEGEGVSGPTALYRHSRDGALAGRLAVCWGCANFLRL